ncbi:MAG: hypothetical protein V1922_02930 [bacterium]
MRDTFNKVVSWYRGLPEKKKHVEFITAVLSVPVMLTVIIINLNNLNQQNNKQKQTIEKTSPIQIVITGEKQTPASGTSSPSPQQLIGTPTGILSPTPQSCIKEVGPVSILFPVENEVVTQDPVCITVATQSSYCPLVWAYRLETGNWSDFTNKNICLRNMTNGTKTIQLKVKSTASDDQIILQRSFVYEGNNEPTATPPSATSSAGL